MNKWRQLAPRLHSFHTVLMILITLGYLLATHLSTINSLKAAIAGKADRSELEYLDKKLTRIEVKLEEAVITKNEFNRLREYLDRTIMEVALRFEGGRERDAEHGK